MAKEICHHHWTDGGIYATRQAIQFINLCFCPRSLFDLTKALGIRFNFAMALLKLLANKNKWKFIKCMEKDPSKILPKKVYV